LIIRNSIFILFSTVIAVADWKTMKIPDMLTGLLFVCLLVSDICILSVPVLPSLCSAGAVYALLYAVYRWNGGLGFGDVKYAAVIGYLLGFFHAVLACLAASLLGLGFFFIRYVLNGRHHRLDYPYQIAFAPFPCSSSFLDRCPGLFYIFQILYSFSLQTHLSGAISFSRHKDILL